MSSGSGIVNRARAFAMKHLWRNVPEQVSETKSPRNFTTHMVAIVAKLVVLRGGDGMKEYLAVSEIFHLTDGVRRKLHRSFQEAMHDPLPAEYHAKQIGVLYHHDREKRRKVMRSLVRIAVAATAMVTRDEYVFLKAIAHEMNVSERYFHFLCEHYGIEIPAQDPYTILGIHRLASQGEIKRRYHQLVREYHPDQMIALGYSDSEVDVLGQKMAEINQAYHRLRSNVQ